MSVTVKIPNLKGYQKALKSDSDKALMSASQILRGNIVKEWLAGRGADGKQFAKGTKEYLKYKRSKGRKAKIDLNFSGDLQQSFAAKKVRTGLIQLYFSSALQRKKAQGLYNRRRNMLKVSKKLKHLTRMNYWKKLRQLKKMRAM